MKLKEKLKQPPLSQLLLMVFLCQLYKASGLQVPLLSCSIVISPGLQDRMIAAAGIKTVFTVNASHSPFLSQPHEIADLLLTISQ
jgi:hypothetical protein